MAELYKLRCTLRGHSTDVRAVAPAYFPEGAIITGSRDRTIRVWTPNKNEVNYSEAHCMAGPTKYVSSVCALPPSDQFPCGLILAGSNDCSIYGFSLDSPQPVYKLLGHAGTVCSLSAGKYGTILSGSWDKTAKIWLGQQCTMTLEGHQAAVWAVQILPEQGLMLTGSADKTIRMWRSGSCEKIFRGHTDCVRGLAVLSNREFLSCSNDATIRLWHITGDCLHVYYGHTNFIYGIAVIPGSEAFATCSEDRTVRIWQDRECCQVMRLPAQSVWAITCLDNGDIVTGDSDGVARIFTCHNDLQASPEEQLLLEEEISKTSLTAEEIGDLKLNSIQGKELLYEPGSRDGQVIIVRDGSLVTAHQWSAAEGKWLKVGDVVGASGSTQNTSGKTLYEGEEYDYVFTVEIEEGKSLKLPYNITEDPWAAAQQFIHKHNLSQFFLDQTANFIINNTRGMTFEQHSPTGSDPFTGGSRYIPGNAQTPSSPPTSADSYSSNRSYFPVSEQTANTSNGVVKDEKTETAAFGDSISNTYFPQTEYVTFDVANVEGITAKLKEFNKKVMQEQQLSDEEITDLLKLIGQSDDPPTDKQMASLEKAIHWPSEMVFPGLDVLRLSVRRPSVNKQVCETAGVQLTDHLLSFLSSDGQVANKMLSLRTFCNLFSHSQGEKLLTSQVERILSTASNCHSSDNRNVQISLATLYLNYVITFQHEKLEAKSQCISKILSALKQKPDSEAQFRLLVALGTSVWNDSEAVAFAKTSELPVLVEKMSEIKDPPKVGQCAEYLLSVLFCVN